MPRRSGRIDVIELGVPAVLTGAFLLFPDQVIAVSVSVVRAVIAPIADSFVRICRRT